MAILHGDVGVTVHVDIDHIVPYALGGSAALDNLRLLCATHHRYRHARLVTAGRKLDPATRGPAAGGPDATRVLDDAPSSRRVLSARR